MFFYNVLVGSLILCAEPALSVLMLAHLHFPPWQYGLAFAAPCIGGLVGSRLSRRLVERFGGHTVMLVSGTLSVGWPIGLAFIPPGTPGLLLVMGLQFGLVTSVGSSTRWPRPPAWSRPRRSGLRGRCRHGR